MVIINILFYCHYSRCRLRVLSAGMRRVCLNHEVWSNLKLENDCHLYIQELNSSESIVEPDKQIDLLIRRFHPVTRNCDPIQEIVLEDFTAKGLRAKVIQDMYLYIGCLTSV